MLKALRQPQLFRLWLGQAFSSVGDEIYRVGLTWFAVGLMGANTGYLTAAQTASLMLLSIIGGKWADHWNPIKTMLWVDLIRAFIVLIPVVLSFFMQVPLISLWMVALSLSGLSAFFDPANQATIPLLAKDHKTLQATNGGAGHCGFTCGLYSDDSFFYIGCIDLFDFGILCIVLEKVCSRTD
jgi:MFS family permease